MSAHIDIGLVTQASLPQLSEDDAVLLQALRDRGLRAEPLVWDDTKVDWSKSRLTMIRSPWDYHLRHDEFLRWVDRVSRLSDLWNRADTVRWNSHKTYLRDLEERGVPVIPTLWLRRGESVDLAGVTGERGWVEVVIKPVVSLSAYGTLMVTVARVEEGQAHLDKHAVEREMMVQPYLRAVEGYGERSLMYIDGEFSHAVRRSPALSRVADEPFSSPVEASRDEAALAEMVLAAAGYDTLYARVDVVPGEDGEPLLMELELVEPSLFFPDAPDAVERMISALERRLG